MFIDMYIIYIFILICTFMEGKARHNQRFAQSIKLAFKRLCNWVLVVSLGHPEAPTEEP